jgi:peptide/nickel transport system ATP-binding protein
MTTTLDVRHLSTHFATRDGIARAVDDVSFTVKRGEIMGLVGESGSGKSMTGFSLIGLVDPPGRIVAGEVLLTLGNGQTIDVCKQTPWALQHLRGNRIAMIFQDPMMTLNPVLRVDTQMIETILAHGQVSKAVARDRARDALARVGIAAPDERLQSYPHQFSGGMRQRVAIAMALLNKPDVIIADEPTTALDVTIQGQILFEMQKLCRESGTALLWITHDLSVVAGLADTVSVMYAGRILEQGSAAQVLEDPRHPYTHGLLASVPEAVLHEGRQRLHAIPGMTPSLLELPSGCAFAPRCERATKQCEQVPNFFDADARLVRCFHPLVPVNA